MERWEIAAQEFIKNCGLCDIEAVFLVGSFAVGNADEYSDIDLYMVLDDGVNWRERGNRRVDGYLIEYFANPMRQIKKYIAEEYTNANMTTINMILNGVILLDKSGLGAQLLAHCLKQDLGNFPALSDFQVKTQQYSIWHHFNELERAHAHKTADFAMQYHIFIKTAFEFYSRYICSPVPNYDHIYKWLHDKEYRDKFSMPQYNDPAFLALMRGSFGTLDADDMLARVKCLKDYIYAKTGGFDINNFALKSKC